MPDTAGNPTHADCAEAARAAIAAWSSAHGEDRGARDAEPTEETIADVIADLLHLAVAAELDPEEVLDHGRRYFEGDLEERDPGTPRAVYADRVGLAVAEQAEGRAFLADPAGGGRWIADPEAAEDENRCANGCVCTDEEKRAAGVIVDQDDDEPDELPVLDHERERFEAPVAQDDMEKFTRTA